MKTRRWQSRRSTYALRTERAIPARRRQAVRDFMAWYRAQYSASHFVAVYACQVRRLFYAGATHPQGSNGLFWMPHHPRVARHGPAIYVAALRRSTRAVLQTLAHELAHYDEWARTGWSTERGKDQRADALVRQYARTHRVPA